MFTGTELTKANLHTADGISVRFPRVTRIRNDKDWQTATNLEELKHLYKTSKEKTDVSLLNKLAATASSSEEPPRKKIKASPKHDKVKIEESSSDEPPRKKIKESPEEDKVKKTSRKNKVKDSPKKDKLKIPKIDSFLTKVKKENLDKSNDSNSLSDSKDSSHDTIIYEPDEKEEVEFPLLPDNPLPDAFLDKVLLFYPEKKNPNDEEIWEFKRHWIAYGGEIAESPRPNVDYVVHFENTIKFRKMEKLTKKLSPKTRHVTVHWLIQSINDIALCDTAKYPVYVEPLET